MKTTKAPSSAILLFSLAVGTFMSALDTSAVTVTVSSIQNDFHASLSSVEWIITAYLLVISGILLTFGRLADICGHRRIYISGFVAFTASSLLCGLSTGITMLIAARVAQAIGAAMMFSSNSAIVTANVPATRRGKAFGLLAIAVASACCVGPVVGGLLVGTFGWRSIFFLNVPIGIVGTCLAWHYIPRDEPRVNQPFDYAGSLLVLSALFLILLPLDLSTSGGFSKPLFFGLLAGGAALFAVFIWWEGKVDFPMLRLDLFRNRVFSSSLAACTLNFTAQFMMAFLAPYYCQKILLLSPAMTGLLYMPMPLATMFVAPLSGSFSDRHDSRFISSIGMAIMACALVLLSFLDIDTPYWYTACAMALAGIGSGMFQSPNNSAVMGCAPAEHRGAASGTLATMRNIGMVFGVALSGAIFSAWSARDGVSAASATQATAINIAGATRGLHATFIAASVAALLAMLASLVKGSTHETAGKCMEAQNKAL